MDMYPLAPCQCEDPQAQKQEHGCSWHRSKPKGSPEKMSPTPNKLKKNRDSPTCSTDNLLSLDSDHSDTSSTMYAASAASTSVEELAEVKPRIFLDVVDNAIDTEYPTPKPPSQDGSPDPYHDLKLGTEVLLERKPCNCRIHDLENRRLGCEAHERLRVQGTGALSSPGIKDADIPKETVPETVGMPDTGVDRETKSVTAGRPRNRLLSKFKKLIKLDEKRGELVECREKEDQKQNVTGMTMLAATMGYGMGRF